MNKLTPQEMVLVAMFASLAVVGAMIFRFLGGMIVPFSLLPLIALLAGGLLGPRLGALSMGIYVVMGVLGVPVFESPPYGGLAYLLKPTFGFLLGFILAAYLTGLILQGHRNAGPLRLGLAMFIGLLAIWAVGLPYLYLILNFYLGQAYDLSKILLLFCLPYIGFDILKALFVAAVVRMVGARLPVFNNRGREAVEH